LIVALLVLGSVGFVARVGFALLARGTNDVETWARFAMQIAKHGVLYQYVHDAGFNHPPLMGWLARSILALSEATGIRFTFLFKLPMIAADLGTGALLAHAFLLRSGRRQGALAFALYGWSPISFMATPTAFARCSSSLQWSSPSATTRVSPPGSSWAPRST
jgi:hypothetical protein